MLRNFTKNGVIIEDGNDCNSCKDLVTEIDSNDQNVDDALLNNKFLDHKSLKTIGGDKLTAMLSDTVTDGFKNKTVAH